MFNMGQIYLNELVITSPSRAGSTMEVLRCG